MAAEDSFLVEIILKAVDQASGPIRNLNKAVDELKAKAAAGDATGDLSRGLEDMGDAANDSERDLRSHRQEVERHGQATSKQAQSTKKGADALDDHASSADGARQKVQALGDETDNLAKKQQNAIKSAAQLSKQLNDLERSFGSGAKNSDDYINGLNRIQSAYESLSKSLPIGNQLGEDLHRSALMVKGDAASIRGDLSSISKEHVAAAGAADRERAATDALAQRVANLHNAYQKLQGATKDMGLDEQARAFQQVGSEASSLTRKLEINSDAWRDMSRIAADASKTAKDAGRDLRSAVQDISSADSGSSGGGGFFKGLVDSIQDFASHVGSIKLVSLSAQLRGLALGTAIALFNQLDTAIVGVVGGLFSLGSAAAQAAATVGGTFVAAMGQAVPAVAIFADALNRLKLVMSAVTAAQNLQQQSATNSTNQAITALSNTNAIISAQQTLANSYIQVSNAQEQVRASQVALTQARIDAQRQIQDLMYAEQAAMLAEKGANITLQQAQQNLQQTILTGGTGTSLESAQLGVQQAQLGQRQARTAVPRARFDANQAQRRGVEGDPSVVSARQSSVQAAQGLQQANQAIGSANRALQLAQLSATQATSSIATAANQLKYLLGELSPTEKALYNSLNNLSAYFRDPSSPFNKIADYILAPFVTGLNNVLGLLNDQKFLAPFNQLGQKLGGGLNSIIGGLTGKQGAGFLDQMAKDASKNVPIVVGSIKDLMKIFEDIAKAAAPALHTFVKDFNGFVGSLSQKWSTPQGLDKLTTFFNNGAKYAEQFVKFGGAALQLLMSLGHQAAPVGGGLLGNWTKELDNLNTWVQGHGTQVRQFFQQTATALNDVFQAVGAIGKGMVDIMNAGGLTAFTKLFSDVIVPTVADAAHVLGTFTNVVIELLNKFPALHTFLDAFGGFALAGVLVGKLSSPLRKLLGLMNDLRKGDFSKIFGSGSSKISLDSEGMETAATTMNTAADKMAAAADKMATAATAQDGAADKQVTAGTEQGAAADKEILAGEEHGIGGGGLPGGAGGVAAETETAEGAAGGGALATGSGALGALGPLALAGGGAFLFGQLMTSIFNKGGPALNANKKDLGLGSWEYGMLGHDSKTEQGLAGNFLQQAQGIDPSNLSSKQLQQLQTQAKNFAALPDITTTQRKGLQDLITNGLNPAKLAAKQFQDQWKQGFQGIADTTPNVIGQVATTLKNQVSAISSNLGTGTAKGASALVATIAGAVTAVQQNTSLMVRNTGKGVEQIDKMLSSALKALGVNADSKTVKILGLAGTEDLAKNAAAGNPVTAIPGAAGNEPNIVNTQNPGFAAGGWHSATPGGSGATVGEGGYDEVTLTTDPKHASRQGALLGKYLSSAPHMAKGGFVADPGTNFSFGQEPKIVAALARLANYMHGTVYGISGYRSPEHSAAVGGFGNDPHTRGQAADIGWNSSLRASAGSISNAMLARFGLWRPFDMSGQDPNEINHIQLLPGAGGPVIGNTATSPADSPKMGASGSQAPVRKGGVSAHTAAMVSNIVAPKLQGVGGALGAVGQGVLNQVTKAANSYLGKVQPANSGGVGGGGGDARYSLNATSGGSGYTPATFARAVLQAFGMKQSNQAIEDFMTWERFEGGNWDNDARYNPLNTTQQEAGSGDTGSQGDIGVYQTWASGLKATVATLSQGIYSGIRGALARGAPLSQFEAAVIASPWGTKQFADGGIAGNAPWGGRPVPIIAHEGERISNPNQWGHIAGLAGMSAGGLDAHMGYSNGSPKQSFADGGAPGYQNLGVSGLANAITVPTFDSGTSPLQTLSSVTQVVKYLNSTFKKLDSIGSQAKLFANQFKPFVDSLLTQGTGIFDRLSAGFTSLQNTLGSQVVLGGGGFKAAYGQGGLTERLGQPAQDAQAVRSQQEQTQYLTGEKTALDKSLSKVSAQKKIDPGKYTAEYNALVTRVQDVTSQLAQSVSDTFSARTQQIQDLLTKVGDKFSTQQETIQGRQSTATAAGNYNTAASADTALGASLNSQYKALQPVLKQAEKSGNSDLVAQVKQQMADLKSSAAQAAIQALSDATTAITNKYTTTQGNIQNKQSTAESAGNYNTASGLDTQLSQSSQNEIDALQPMLAKAKASHDTGLTQQIEQQISQLQATVDQAALQAITDAQQAVDQAAQTALAGGSMLTSEASTAMGAASTPAGFAAAGAQNLAGLQANASAYSTQMTGLQGLLAKASAAGDTGEVDTLTQEIDQLNSSIVANNQAITDNTAQTVQQTASFIQSRGQFSTGVYGGIASIINTIGQTTGFTDVNALKSVTGQENTSLQGTNTGLLGQLTQLGGGATGIASSLSGVTDPGQFASILGSSDLSGAESGQSSTWITTFEGIISNLESNTEAIATNNQQLAELNGQLLQPQQWSTSAWANFRTAIFSGMGNLLPQYQNSLAGTGYAPSIAPIYGTVAPSGQPTIGSMTINHVPGTTLQPAIVGEQMAHEVSKQI